MATITLAKVNKAIHAKFPEIKLIRGEGYYYIYSDNEALSLKIAGLFTSSIPVYSIKHASIEKLVEMVEHVLNDLDRSIYEREPITFN